ncbi:MAG: glycosyl hydrolase family 18 protein, partial [Catonella sp.]
VYFVEEYNLDGINIDFEKVKASYARGYIQFLRELSIEMRNRNKVLSIDNYIPLDFNEFYNLKEQGVVADYICVMAYDEHYAGSDEAGSVSSLNWVKKSIENTAKNVPMNKIIVGLPFYTRIWRETDDGKLKTKALGMEGGLNLVSEYAAKKEWNDELGQYYAEWKDGKDKMRIWLEEERSLAAKLKQVNKEKAAGIAFWKLGLERKEAWKSVTDWLK